MMLRAGFRPVTRIPVASWPAGAEAVSLAREEAEEEAPEAEEEDAEDVVQETFLRAWRDVENATLSGDGAFFGWLTTLARHAIVDVARAARAQKRDGEPRRLEHISWSRSGALDPADPAAAATGRPGAFARLAETRRR